LEASVFNSPYDVIAWLAAMGIAQAFVLLPPVRRALALIAPSAFDRVAVGVALGFSTIFAGAKSGISPRAYVCQYITAMSSGVIIDESGAVARASEAAVLDAFLDLANQINAGASNAVVNASNEFAEAADMVTNNTRRVIYVASFLPRSGAGGITNHNIASTVERVRQSDDGQTISAWIWFSEEPLVAPGIAADVDVGGGPFRLTAVTNYYPATESIGGAPCVRYDFTVPSETIGTVLIPSYEVAFGSSYAPLIVPSGGISVVTNGVTRLPFSGTDTYFSNRVQVVYKGGIAVSATIDGGAVTNGVYEL
jgi:hypothetical protein